MSADGLASWNRPDTTLDVDVKVGRLATSGAETENDENKIYFKKVLPQAGCPCMHPTRVLWRTAAIPEQFPNFRFIIGL